MRLNCWHGSISPPFLVFSAARCGTGVVGCRYRGLAFFSTSPRAARYFADEDVGHLARWQIFVPDERVLTLTNIGPAAALRGGWPPEYDVMILQDILDGDSYGDTVIVSLTLESECIKRCRVIPFEEADLMIYRTPSC